MPVQVFNPLSEVVSGILQAHQLANQIRRSQLEQHQFDLQKQRIADQRTLQEFNIGSAMSGAGAREATAADRLEADSGLKYVPNETMPGVFPDTMAVSDLRSRMLPATPGGRRYVMPSPQEQMDRKLREQRAENETKLDLHRGMNLLDRVSLPDVAEPVDRNAVPYYAARETRAAADRRSAEAGAAADRRSAEANSSREKISANANASRERAAKLKAEREPGLTPGQVETKAERARRALERARKDIDQMQVEEQTLHAENVTAGQTLTAGEISATNGEMRKLNRIERARIGNKITANKKAIGDLQRRQRDLLGREYKVGDIVVQDGKRFKVLGKNGDGTIRVEPLTE